MVSPQPADGTAIILHLIEAARAQKSADVEYWVEKLEERFARERIEPEPVGWGPRRWKDLVAGDTVSLGGQEAVIESAGTQRWHVDPKSSEYRPVAMEHDVTAIRLVGREPLYRMPPDGEVETLRGPAGQAVDEANGYRSAFGEEEIDVMTSWIADVALTLEEAGLGPIEVLR